MEGKAARAKVVGPKAPCVKAATQLVAVTVARFITRWQAGKRGGRFEAWRGGVGVVAGKDFFCEGVGRGGGGIVE